MSSIKLISALIAFFFFSACTSVPPFSVSNNIASLNDDPPIEFSTSGWNFTNTTKPMFLTPDYLTNAMIAVSRMKPGDSFPKNGPKVTEDLSPAATVLLMRTKLADKPDLQVAEESINGKNVVVAKYTSGTNNGIEYALNLNGILVHVFLLAESGAYFESGKTVALEIVKTVKRK